MKVEEALRTLGATWSPLWALGSLDVGTGTKSTRLSYKYFKNGYNVEVSQWNAKKQAYDLPSEVTLYRQVAPSLTSVKTYKMNETQDNMYLTSRMMVMDSLDSQLLATTR